MGRLRCKSLNLLLPKQATLIYDSSEDVDVSLKVRGVCKWYSTSRPT